MSLTWPNILDMTFKNNNVVILHQILLLSATRCRYLKFDHDFDLWSSNFDLKPLKITSTWPLHDHYMSLSNLESPWYDLKKTKMMSLFIKCCYCPPPDVVILNWTFTMTLTLFLTLNWPLTFELWPMNTRRPEYLQAFYL